MMNLVYRTVRSRQLYNTSGPISGSLGISSPISGSLGSSSSAVDDCNNHKTLQTQHVQDGSSNHGYTSIKGVIFDMDGTMTVPILDFKEMRRRVGIPNTADILIYVNSLEEGKKKHALEIIEEMEEEANTNIKLQLGLVEILSYLAENKVSRGLVTRNNSHSIDVFLKALQPLLISSPYTHPILLNQPVFTHILSRDFQPHKPHPAPIQHICTQWSLPPANVLMVGDEKTDVLSGNAAGTVTALLLNESKELPNNCPHDVIVSNLNELLELLKRPFDCVR